MVAISFSVYELKGSIETGIAEANGLIRFWNSSPKIKRQTIRLINVSFKKRTWEETINLINSNKRLPYNTIQNTKVLHLYWKQRTPECEKLGTVNLKDIFPIKFEPSKIVRRYDKDFFMSHTLDSSEKFALALRDGFPNYEKLKDWFLKTHGLKIYSYFFAVIRW